MPPRGRPVGQPTRGKTALNRLRQIDIYVALAHSGALLRGTPLIVDLGFGAYPWTTLEMRQRWLRLNPRAHVLGVEIDPQRVAAALAYADPPFIDFRLGGFNLTEVLGPRRARLIRCFNVLRQYDESAVRPALLEMAQALEPGGILIEGTSNPTGRIAVFDVYRKESNDLRHESLVFGTNFRAPVDPVDFQTILPKRLIHHMLDAKPSAFLTAWRKAFTLVWRRVGYNRGQSRQVWRGQWIVAAHLLQSRFGYPVDARPGLIRRGYVALHESLSEESLDSSVPHTHQ